MTRARDGVKPDRRYAMPKKIADLEVAVPSQRVRFGGGLDNPEEPEQPPTSGGAVRSNKSAKRKERRPRPFPPTPAAGPPSLGLSDPFNNLDVGSGPISNRTRLRKKLGFPLKPGASALNTEDDSSRTMAPMGVEAARMAGKQAAAEEAKSKRRAAGVTAVKELSVVVPSQRVFFGGGIDNPDGDDVAVRERKATKAIANQARRAQRKNK